MRAGNRFLRIFAIPIVLFGVSLSGLVAALLVQGAADSFFALAAGAGIFVASAVLFFRR